MTLLKLYSVNANWTLETVITVHDMGSRSTPLTMTIRKAIERYDTREIAFFRDNRVYLY
mgnify:CR=1 FL=1